MIWNQLQSTMNKVCFVFLNHLRLFAFDAFYAGISYPRFQFPSLRPLLKGHLLSEGFAGWNLVKIVIALLLSTMEIQGSSNRNISAVKRPGGQHPGTTNAAAPSLLLIWKRIGTDQAAVCLASAPYSPAPSPAEQGPQH